VQIGVLEWICGGGLQAVASDSIASSLRQEGKAMLRTVAEGFRSDGHEVSLSLDARLFTQAEQRELGGRFEVFENIEFQDGLPSSWWEVAKSVDVVLIIAPEFSSILQSAIESLSTVSRRLMNCRGDFLNAGCDKWVTAQRWRGAGVPHPATQLLSDVTVEWLDENRGPSDKWILKPRDGAGCDGIKLLDESGLSKTIAEYRSQTEVENYILQPFHSGKSYSRSAIVDVVGKAHWLPFVTQELSFADSISYHGGEVLLEECMQDKLDGALHSLGQGALGWVGFDMVHCEAMDQWLVIEANPRLTTSFVGLSRSYGNGLSEQLLRACTGGKVELVPAWQRLKFDASGKELPL